MTITARTEAFQLSAGVARLVTEDMLAGGAMADPEDFASPLATVKIDIHGLMRLQEEAINRFAPNDSECDAWLAPRLHCLLRLTRRQSHDQGLWRWLALQPLTSYVRHRWAMEGKVKAERYLGTGFSRRNAISRLWWAAEVMRHGPDYREAATVLRDSALDQYILDLRYGYLRASALGMVRVCTGRHAGIPAMTFDQIKQLSKRVNLLLSATTLESLAEPEVDELGAIDANWLAEVPEPEVVIKQKLEDLRGPNDGKVSDDEINHFERWYADIARDIVVV